MTNLTANVYLYQLGSISSNGPITSGNISATSSTSPTNIYGLSDFNMVTFISGNSIQSNISANMIQADFRVKYYSFSGSYKIAGIVEINTIPSPNKFVFCFPVAAPSLCIASTVTDATGAYLFDNLAAGRYKVYAMDPSFSYNSKMYDNIAAVTM